jgi:hypothetical protein
VVSEAQRARGGLLRLAADGFDVFLQVRDGISTFVCSLAMHLGFLHLLLEDGFVLIDRIFQITLRSEIFETN